MDDAIFRESLRNAHWTLLLRPLATTRTGEFLAESGIPTELSGSPGGLQRSARRFLGESESRKGQLGQESDDRHDLAKRLEIFFDDLETTYSRDPVARFRSWALRHGGDNAERMKWNGWSCLFLKLATSAALRAGSAIPISQIAGNTVRGRFGPTAISDLADRIDRARLERLSAEQAGLVQYDPSTFGTGGKPADDLDLVAVLITDERAYSTWVDLGQLGTKADLDWLASWARLHASECGVTLDQLGQPPA